MNFRATAQFIRRVGLLCVLGVSGVQAEVLLTGVDDELANNIRAHLVIVQEDCKAPRWRLTQRRKEIIPQLEQALQAFGYYSFEAKQTFVESESCWQLTIDVALGERTRIREVQVVASDMPSDINSTLHELFLRPALRSGQALNHSDYDNYKSALLDGARAEGYWRAHFTEAELAIYPEQKFADVHLVFSFGQRYFFGDYEFSETPLEEELLRRLGGDITGTPYSSDAIQDIYSRLQGSGYFRQVLLNPRIDPNGESVVVPVAVELGMNSQTSVTTGVGYSSDQGARIRADYKNRYFNPYGHKWRADALISESLQELGSTYTIPGKEASREWYEINIGWVQESTVSYENQLATTRIRAIEALPHDWIINTGINLRYESYQVGSEEPDEQWLVVPGVGVTWVNVNNDVRQTLGIRFEADLTGSSKYWLSGTNFLQLRIKSKFILPISENGRILVRGEVAGTLLETFSELPPSLRFFTGGDNSVRGYQYESVGPVNEEGEVIGGSHLAVVSGEYDYLFLPSWSASIFYDAGDAFDSEVNLRRGAGLGLRWYSPVGPLRIDIAKPFDSEDNYRIHISVGADL